MAHARGRPRAHPLLAARPDHAGQLRVAEGGVAVRSRRRRRRHDGPRHAELRRRQAAERRRTTAARRVDRPDEWQAALELGRAGNVSIEVLHARVVREGRGVLRIERPRRRLHHDARLLPGGARCRNRQAARELGAPRRRAGVSAHRRRRRRGRPDSRLGAVAASRTEVQRQRGRAARARLHHELVTADRGERRRHRRQLRRAGLPPDAAGERTGRHRRLRCQDRQVPVEVPCDSAARRGRP